MSQIAQQDHLYIPVENLAEITVTDDFWATLSAKFKAGTLLDCVLTDSYGQFGKIVSVGTNPDDGELLFAEYIFDGLQTLEKEG